MEKYFSIIKKEHTIYDENMNRVRSFGFTDEVKGLTQVIRKDTAGEKAVARAFEDNWWGKAHLEDIGGGWYAVIKED